MNGGFVAGDWSHLTLDFKGFAAGSQVELYQQPGNSRLIVQDAQSGATRLLTLSGDAPSLAQLHIVWT